MDKQKTILIVEDEISLADVMKDELERQDFAVLIAKNGSDGLEKIETSKVDLILLDNIMPVMDGIKMLGKLREAKNQTPVIMLTNLGSDDDAATARKLGVTDFLIKSNNSLEEVVTRIKNILDK